MKFRFEGSAELGLKYLGSLVFLIRFSPLCKLQFGGLGQLVRGVTRVPEVEGSNPDDSHRPNLEKSIYPPAKRFA